MNYPGPLNPAHIPKPKGPAKALGPFNTQTFRQSRGSWSVAVSSSKCRGDVYQFKQRRPAPCIQSAWNIVSLSTAARSGPLWAQPIVQDQEFMLFHCPPSVSRHTCAQAARALAALRPGRWRCFASQSPALWPLPRLP